MNVKLKFQIGKKSLIKLSLAVMFISGLLSIMFYFMSTGIGSVLGEVPGPKLIVNDPVMIGNAWSKKLIVYSDGIEHYYNVPVSTSIPENLIKVELYRYLIGNLKKKITDDPKYKFEIKDTDGNGKSDTVSWIVPELSEVSFSVEGKLELKQPEIITQQTPITQEEIESFKIETASYEPFPVQNPYDCSASNVNCSLTTVTVDNGNGSITMINYQKPVNFFNSTLGDWQAINITIIPGNFDGYDYGVEQGYQIYYKSQISAGDSIKYCNEGYCFTTQPSKITYRNLLDSNDDISQLNTSTIGNTTDNKFRWDNTFTDCDLEYTYGGGTHKEYMILKQKPRDPAGYLGDVSNVTFDVVHYIKFPVGVDMYVNGTIKTDDFKTSERIEFRNESNVTFFYLPKPYAIDSNETTLNSIDLVYDIVWDKKYNPSKERLIWFYIQTPYSWLNEIAIYPVYIEPSVGIDYNTTVDVYDIWNQHDHYYVNATSGIEVTNHFQEYWTQNQICVNFTWGSLTREYCAGESDWTWYNTTDDSTFSNLTGTTTAKWAGHEWDIVLEYYLTSNAHEIRITPTATNQKNRNYDKVEFKWRVHDIKVNMTYEDDWLAVDTGLEDNEWYQLNDSSLNLIFNETNLTDRKYMVFDNETIPRTFISTRWNESKWVNGEESNMTYELKVIHDSEYNAPIDLILDFGSVAPNDVLSTNFYWQDPKEATYIFMKVYDVTDYCPGSTPDCNSTAYKFESGTLVYNGNATGIDYCNSTIANPTTYCYDMEFEEGKVYRIEYWFEASVDLDPIYIGAEAVTMKGGFREGWKVRLPTASSNEWVSTSNGVYLYNGTSDDTATAGQCVVPTSTGSTKTTYTWTSSTGDCDTNDCGSFFKCASIDSDTSLEFESSTGGTFITYASGTKNWYIECDGAGGDQCVDLMALGDEGVFNIIMWFDNSSSETLGRSATDASTCKPGSNTGCAAVWVDMDATVEFQNYWDVFRNRKDYSVGLICDDGSCAGNPELEYNMTLTHLGYSVTPGTSPTAGKDVLVALAFGDTTPTHAYYEDLTDVTSQVSDTDDTYASKSCATGFCTTEYIYINFTTSGTYYDNVTIEWKVDTDDYGYIDCWKGSSWSGHIITIDSITSDVNSSINISICSNSDGNYTFRTYATDNADLSATISVDYMFLNSNTSSAELKTYIQSGNATVITSKNASIEMVTLGYAFTVNESGITDMNFTDSQHPVSETYSGNIPTHLDGTGDSIWYTNRFVGRTLGINVSENSTSSGPSHPLTHEEVDNEGILTNPTGAYDDGIGDTSTKANISVTSSAGQKTESVVYEWNSLEGEPGILYYIWNVSVSGDDIETAKIYLYNWDSSDWGQLVLAIVNQSQATRTIYLNRSYINSTGGVRAKFEAQAAPAAGDAFVNISLYDTHVSTTFTSTGIIDADVNDTSDVTVGARVAFVGDQPSTDTGKFLTWDGKELFLRSLHWAAGEGLNITQPNNQSSITVAAESNIFVNFTVWDIQNDTEVTSGITTAMVDINVSSYNCSVSAVTYDTDHWRATCAIDDSASGLTDLIVGVNLTTISDSNFTDRDVEFNAVNITPETEPPKYGTGNQTNSTYAGEAVNFSLNWTDNLGLDKFIFSFDNCTDTLVNDTATSFPGSSGAEWSNVTKVISSTMGCTIRWQIYANDTADNWNASAIYSFVTVNQYGNLEVNLTVPDPGNYTSSNPMEVTQYNTFVANATITCRGGDTCGTVSGSVRYNASSNPDTFISTTTGATPFYIPSDPDMIPTYAWGSGGDITDDVNDTDNTYASESCSGSTWCTTPHINISFNTTETYDNVTIEWRITADPGLEDDFGYLECWDGSDWIYVGGPTRSTADVNNTRNITYCSNSGGWYNFSVWGQDYSDDSVTVWVDYMFLNKSVDGLGINTQSCGSLSQDQQCQLNWTINATGAPNQVRMVDANFTSSLGNATVPENDTDDAYICIGSGCVGAPYLEVNLTYPPIGTTNVDMNSTFNVNATVTCKSGNCGIVNGTIRYNATSTNPDTTINTTTGDKPFYNTSGNISQSCGTLNQDQSCQLNWTINATGDFITGWKIGVKFNSSDGSIADNHTDNATIRILECTDSGISLAWSTLDFEVLNFSTENNTAPGNSNGTYNITNLGTCTLKLWIKGTNLENTTLNSEILVGNLTWNNGTNDANSAYRMTTNYVILNSSFTPSMVNITTYYWLTVPWIYAGRYNGTKTLCENTSQQSGASDLCV